MSVTDSYEFKVDEVLVKLMNSASFRLGADTIAMNQFLQYSLSPVILRRIKAFVENVNQRSEYDDTVSCQIVHLQYLYSFRYLLRNDHKLHLKVRSFSQLLGLSNTFLRLPHSYCVF